LHQLTQSKFRYATVNYGRDFSDARNVKGFKPYEKLRTSD